MVFACCPCGAEQCFASVSVSGISSKGLHGEESGRCGAGAGSGLTTERRRSGKKLAVAGSVP